MNRKNCFQPAIVRGIGMSVFCKRYDADCTEMTPNGPAISTADIRFTGPPSSCGDWGDGTGFEKTGCSASNRPGADYRCGPDNTWIPSTGPGGSMRNCTYKNARQNGQYLGWVKCARDYEDCKKVDTGAAVSTDGLTLGEPDWSTCGEGIWRNVSSTSFAPGDGECERRECVGKSGEAWEACHRSCEEKNSIGPCRACFNMSPGSDRERCYTTPPCTGTTTSSRPVYPLIVDPPFREPTRPEPPRKPVLPVQPVQPRVPYLPAAPDRPTGTPEKIQAMISKLESQIGKIEANIAKVEVKIEKEESKRDKLEAKRDAFEEKGKSTAAIERAIASTGRRIELLELRIAQYEAKTQKIEDEILRLYQMLSVIQ